MTPPRVALLGLAWLGLVVVLLGRSALRDGAPGDPGSTGPRWPAASALRPAAAGTTLVTLLHPECPCSRASLDELEALLVRAPLPRAYVLVVRPAGAPAGFDVETARRRAARIPGVVAVVDEGGLEAARFGARTSGHTTLWGPDGRLRFSGGLTPGRGLRGDSAGRRAVERAASASTAEASPAAAPVFGCPLQESDAP